jgi:hypothetical protein
MIGSNGRRLSIARAMPDVRVHPVIFDCPDALSLRPVHFNRRSPNESLHQASDFPLYLAPLIFWAYVFDNVLKIEVVAVF